MRPVSAALPIVKEPSNVVLPTCVCKHDPSSTSPPFTEILPALSVRVSKPLKFWTEISPAADISALNLNGDVGLLLTEFGKIIERSMESLEPASKPPLVSGTVAFTVRMLGSLPGDTSTLIRPNSLSASLLLPACTFITPVSVPCEAAGSTVIVILPTRLCICNCVTLFVIGNDCCGNCFEKLVLPIPP